MKQVQRTLIATLGSEAQVVTAALDLLRQRACPVHQVWVVHTQADDPALQESLRRIQQAAGEYPKISFQFFTVNDSNERPLKDVETPEDVQAAFYLLYALIYKAKQAGQQVHLCIAGGRKVMALFGMSAAQMLFDDQDRLWYLYSAGEFLSSKRLHPQPGDEARLVEVPVLFRSIISPALRSLRGYADAGQALDHLRALEVEERVRLGREFVARHLTPSEQRVVRLLVQGGLSDQEIAARLSLSPRTVGQHLRSAYAKAAQFWQLEEMNRIGLTGLLSLYYALTDTS